jgi:hypothetical protein
MGRSDPRHSKRLRAAKLFDGEVRSAREDGYTVDPRGGKTELHVVYKGWLASRPDLSPKVRRGYEDNWRLRIEPKLGKWPIGRILRENIQEWVNEMTAAGLGPPTVRWTHSMLRMTLHHAIADRKLRGKNPASNVRFPAMGETSHVYLPAVEVTKLAELCDTATGEVPDFGCGPDRFVVTVPDEVPAEILHHRWQVLTGAEGIDPLDAHTKLTH